VNKTGIYSCVKIVFLISTDVTKAAELNSSSNVHSHTNVPASRKPYLQKKSNIVFSEDLPVCNIHKFPTCVLNHKYMGYVLPICKKLC
jgi:hypothetical protein